MTYLLILLALRAALFCAAQWRVQCVLAYAETHKNTGVSIDLTQAISSGTWASFYFVVAAAGSLLFPKVFLLLGVF